MAENTEQNNTGDKASKKNKLIKQILKFAVVGGLSFVIDFVVYTIVVKVIPGKYSYILAGFAGFSISLIFNYLASMAFVFERKEDADRKKEFTIFLVLSLIGMLLNTILLWLYVEGIAGIQIIRNIHEAIFAWISSLGITFFKDADEFIEICAKVFATAIVMVYNFVSRKMTLEKKD